VTIQKGYARLRIALASDLHTLHREVEIPRADLLIVAGDACFMGNGPRQLDDLNDWLGELPVRNRVITAGNHDTRIAADVQMWRKRLSNATLLIKLTRASSLRGYTSGVRR
jgi:metallophosphoesterase superfamily enzyme